MTAEPSPVVPADHRRPATLVRPTVWLLNGVLTVADTDLSAALHKLADHADLGDAGRSTGFSGVILHGRVKLAWSITEPADERLPTLVDTPDPETRYRLLTITVTTYSGLD